MQETSFLPSLWQITSLTSLSSLLCAQGQCHTGTCLDLLVPVKVYYSSLLLRYWDFGRKHLQTFLANHLAYQFKLLYCLSYCFCVLQDMTSAVITYCGHFFHESCLRKWLYVQETCPMCHTSIKPSTSIPKPAAGDAQSNPVQTQHHPPQQEPAAEHTDTHQGEQDPVEDEVHSPDKNFSASEDSAGPSCSFESSPCNERDWETEQRTNQPSETNSALDREP